MSNKAETVFERIIRSYKKEDGALKHPLGLFIDDDYLYVC